MIGALGEIVGLDSFDNQTGLVVVGSVGLISSATILNNRQDGMDLNLTGDTAIEGSRISGNFFGARITVSAGTVVFGDSDLSAGLGNLVTGNQYGVNTSGDILVAGNTISNNVGLGLSLGGSGAFGPGSATAFANAIFGNASGIGTGGDVLFATNVLGNLIYNNSQWGASISGPNAQVRNNVIYSNDTGIVIASGFLTSGMTLANNVVYANRTAAVSATDSNALELLNNTFYQVVGDAIDLFGTSTNADIRNNIIVALSGIGVAVSNASQAGFSSNYNIFNTGSGGRVGQWQGDRSTLRQWQTATLNDANSMFGDPGLVSPAGADGIVGYSAALNGSDDDFHETSAYGTPVGGTLAVALDPVSGLPVQATGTLTDFPTTSLAVDRGDPSVPVGAEPAPNGNFINIGAYGGTTQAARSASTYIRVIAPDGGETIGQESTYAVTWRSAGFPGTVDLELIGTENDTSGVIPIANGVSNTGIYEWTVDPAVVPVGFYRMQVSETADPSVSGISDNVFDVTPPIHVYYVNDGSTAGDEYATAVGNDANDGLTPATPKATIQSVLASYSVGAGDTIFVDTGTYNLTSNITLDASHSGNASLPLNIVGPQSHVATLDRGNTAAGTADFAFTGASYVTVRNLTLTGASREISVADNSNSSGIEVDNSTVTVNDDSGGGTGVYVGSGDQNFRLDASTVSSTGPLSPTIGVELSSAVDGSITNTVFTGLRQGIELSSAIGITISDSSFANASIVSSFGSPSQGFTIARNTFTGSSSIEVNGAGSISANVIHGQQLLGFEVGINASGNILVSGNTVQNDGASGSYGIQLFSGAIGQDNVVSQSDIGIIVGEATAQGNRIFANRTAGIDVQDGHNSTVIGNQVYDNPIGIRDDNNGASILNNVIYDSYTAGIELPNPIGASIENNTIVQSGGAALSISSPNSVDIRNNIFTLTDATGILVGSVATAVLTSDYNLFDLEGASIAGQWQSRPFASLTDWQLELGLDAHSFTGVPQFVDPSGPDGRLGYVDLNPGPTHIHGYDTVAGKFVGTDFGADDDFHELATSPTLDRGDPRSLSYLEPLGLSGGRINIGAFGNTPDAVTSAAAVAQVLAPDGGEKLQVGQPTTITWQTAGLAPEDPVLLVDAGGGQVTGSAAWDNWVADTYRVDSAPFPSVISSQNPVDTSGVQAPAAIFQTSAQADQSGIGNKLSYHIGLRDGSYVLRLYFSEPFNLSPGQRLFDIALNGSLAASKFDIVAAAGAPNRAVGEQFAVNVSGGNGLSIDLINDSPVFAALLAGIEIARPNATGSTVTSNVDVSLDNGLTWNPIAAGVASDRFGSGSISWTPSTPTAGSTALIRVTSTNGLRTLSATSDQPFLVAPAGHDFYVDASGNNANSGKSPDAPMASLGALLHAYQLGPGDTVHVAAGHYSLPESIVMGSTDSGTASAPITIVGPSGSGPHAVLDASTAQVGLEIDGAHDIAISGIDFINGTTAIAVSDASDITIDRTTLSGMSSDGIALTSTSNFLLSNNIITGSGSGSGIDAGTSQGVISGNTLTGFNDNIFATGSGSLTIATNIVTVGQGQVGIYADTDPGSASIVNIVGNTVTASSAAASAGIVTRAHATIAQNTVSGFVANGIGVGITTQRAAEVDDNLVFGSGIGIELTGGTAKGNISHDNTGAGIATLAGGAQIIGNTIYNNDVGIQTQNGAVTISNNLIYGNRSEGLYVAGFVAQLGGDSIANNTIVQSGGEGVHISNAVGAGTTSLTLENNIFSQQGGAVLQTDDSSQSAILSDFNLWNLTNGAVAANWNGITVQTLLDLRFGAGIERNSIAADPLFIDPASGNYHLQAGSPAIDAGDPASPYIFEPGPNGDRVNLGFDGDTPAAATSAAKLVQVLAPVSFDKLVEGQSATISWLSSGIATERPVMFINAGGAAVTGPQSWSNWIADTNPVATSSSAQFIDTSGVDLPAPEAVYQTVARAPDGVGNTLDYALALPDGNYVVRLHFASDTQAVGARQFDIVANGVVEASSFDIAAQAGGPDKAVVEEFTASATGGHGLDIALINKTSLGATLAGIEISQIVPAGLVSTTAKVEASYDGGASWQTVSTNASVDRYGFGTATFTPGLTTAGNEALVRVTMGGVTGTSAPFLVANNGHAYYINDGSTVGDQYTTAVGNDRNSGKSPDQPMATLSALLQAYHPGAGDTIYVDAGQYQVLRDIVVGPADSGSGEASGDRFVIQGPTETGSAAVFNRASQTNSASVFRVAGADFVTLADIDLVGGTRGITVAVDSGATGLLLKNDDISGFTDFGLAIEGGDGSVTLDHSRVFGSIGSGQSIGVAIADGTVTIADTEIFGVRIGITQVNFGSLTIDPENVLVERAIVHDNTLGGIGLGGTATVSDSRIFDNGLLNSGFGVSLSGAGASIVDSQVFGQSGANEGGIFLSSGATASGNDVYDNLTGIYARGGAQVLGNRVFANTGSGVLLDFQAASVIGNRIYSNLIGVTADSPFGSPDLGLRDIENNLVYANTSGAIQLSGIHARVVGNTLYQSLGNVVSVTGASTVTFRNNIAWDDLGNILNVAAGSTSSFDSNYNLFWRGAAGASQLGVWAGSPATNLTAWRALTGLDATSREGDPKFREIAGADGVFAGPDTALGGGADDNFGLSPNSPAIDAGDSSVATPTDMVGAPRVGVADIGALEFQGSALDTTPPVVIAVTSLPANNGTTAHAFTSLNITFSEPLDVISARSIANYTLVAAGSDARFDTADDMKVPIVPQYNPGSSTVTLSLPNGILPDGSYRLTLSGSRAIFDASGNALDGDGDGAPGGDYVRIFTIDRSANLPPVVPAQTANLLENTSAAVALAASDPNGDSLTFSILDGPAHGTISGFDPATGRFTYTPNTYYNGSDAIRFRADDGSLGITDGTLALVIAPVNQRPIAFPQSVAAIADVGQLITLAGSDIETASQDLVLQIVSGPAHGQVAIVGQNQVLYTGNPGYNGADSFSFAWTDTGDPAGSGNNPLTSAPAVVSIAVTKVNRPPVAVGDAFTTPEDVALVIPSTAVLANDHDPDLDPLTVVSVANPVHGSVSYQNQTITFTPDFNYFGPAAFDYTISDGALTATAQVIVSVVHGDAAPKAVADSASTLENASLIIDPAALVANDTDIDGDTLSVAGVSNPTNGTIAFDSAAARYVFTPTTYFTGTAGFDYAVTDGTLSRTAHVTINVIPVNQPPVAADDIVTASKHDVPVVIVGSTLLANDTDVDGDTLSIASVGNALDGTVSYDPQSGNVTFTPTTGFAGKAGFDYTVTDGSLTSTAHVTVVIPNTAPVIQFQPSFVIPVNTGIGTFTGFQATDADGDTVTFRLKDGSGPFLGVVNVTPDGNFNYQSTGLTGKDQFTVIADDGHGGTAEATGTIAVTDSSNVAYFTSQVLGFTPSTELWRVGSDGVASPLEGFDGAYPVSGFTAFSPSFGSNNIYFSGDDGLEVIDGSNGTVNSLSNGDINNGIVGLVAPEHFTPFNGELYFDAFDPVSQQQLLWKIANDGSLVQVAGVPTLLPPTQQQGPFTPAAGPVVVAATSDEPDALFRHAIG